MKITNENNLPASLVRAISKNWYGGKGEKRFSSVTELIKPTKLLILEKRHNHEISQEASDLIWMLMGSAVHKVVEAAEDVNCLSEERLAINFEGVTITGGLDLYEDETITDFKFTTVWSYTSGSRTEEYEKQLNLYSYLLRKHGFTVKALQVIAIFRDWSKRKYQQEANYPRQVETIDLRMWSDEEVESFLHTRIGEIQAALDLPDDLLEPCTAAERWEGQEKYAVYKTDGSRALRVFPTKIEAEGFMANHKNEKLLHLVTRQSQPTRCLDYCPVNSYCNYYKSLNETDLEQTA